MFKEYGPYVGEVLTRITGTLIATEAGETTSYALVMCQERGKLFVNPGELVYEGMIVGENPRNEDISLNAVREKKLTNFRSQGEGVAASLTPATKLSLERSIEYIAADELLEVTPRGNALPPSEQAAAVAAASRAGDKAPARIRIFVVHDRFLRRCRSTRPNVANGAGGTSGVPSTPT